MHKKSTVVIEKGEDPTGLTVKVLETIENEVKNSIPKEKPILIKPNYLNSKHPSTGITTDCRIIEGILKFLQKIGNYHVKIGEGSGFANTHDAYRVAGVDKIAERWNVELFDLNNDVFIDANTPDPISLPTIRIAKTALESTIISVPKLKLHRIAGVTLSLKNMMGALASKGSMHRGKLSSRIADLASILRPSLSVIDGVIAGQGHESSEDPIQMDLVIAGIDPVAVDAVGAAVMGVDPMEVKHLVLAQQKKLGICNLEEIQILGKEIDQVKTKFKRSLTSRILGTIF
jgi:uncharacterized protein (DUF362 family)